MGVVDGSPVNASNTNQAFLDANGDDTAQGRINLNDTVGNPTESGPAINNIQREHNSIASFVGKAINVAKDALPSWLSSVVGTATDTIKARVDALTVRFDSTLGHAHDGSAGGGAPISAPNLANVPLRGFFQQGTNLTGVSGGSDDVTTELTGKTPSGGTSSEGVVVSAPYNRAILRDTNGQEFLDAFGNEVYGRVTESAGTWTLTFFVDIAGVETPYSFPAPVTVVWYYQELFNPMVNPPVYDPGAFIPSDAATADVVDASATQRGVVSTGTQSFGGAKTFGDGITVGTSLNPSFLTNDSLVLKVAAGLTQLLLGKGQLVSSSGSGAPQALAVGADGQVLTADSTQTLGLRWATLATWANQALSNLTNPTAVNQDLLPDADQTRNIGSNSLAWLVLRAIRYGAKNTVVTVTGDVTSGSATITNIADTSAINTSQSVVGPGIPNGATVASKTATTVTFSHPAGLTASATTLGASVQFAYMFIGRAEDQSGTTAGGGAVLRAGRAANAAGGPLFLFSGSTSGSGDSGDSFVGSPSSGSGIQGLLWLLGRYVRIPAQSADPADFRAGGLYWNTTSGKFRQANGSAWSDLAGGSAALTPPTTQVFTSGSGNWTRPVGCVAIRVRLAGGGGGGGGSGNPPGVTDGAAGGNTTFGPLTANGGAGGSKDFSNAAGGSASGGFINIVGGNGGPRWTVSGLPGLGGYGGSNLLGAGGAAGEINGGAGTGGQGFGGGGGGGGVTVAGANAGGGGGAGGYCEAWIASPGASIAYSIGGGGLGGNGGVNGVGAGSGAGGVVIVEEFY